MNLTRAPQPVKVAEMIQTNPTHPATSPNGAAPLPEPLDRLEWENGYRWFLAGHPHHTARTSSESRGYTYAYELWCRGVDPRTLTPQEAWDLRRREGV